jgi:hypothetical protein
MLDDLLACLAYAAEHTQPSMCMACRTLDRLADISRFPLPKHANEGSLGSVLPCRPSHLRRRHDYDLYMSVCRQNLLCACGSTSAGSLCRSWGSEMSRMLRRGCPAPMGGSCTSSAPAAAKTLHHSTSMHQLTHQDDSQLHMAHKLRPGACSMMFYIHEQRGIQEHLVAIHSF